jgi:hypothetical protein
MKKTLFYSFLSLAVLAGCADKSSESNFRYRRGDRRFDSLDHLDRRNSLPSKSRCDR